MTERWVFFGFGMSPFLLRSIVDLKTPELAEIEWDVILPTGHHRTLLEGIEGIHSVVVVEEMIKRGADSWRLTNFSDQEAWSVYRDLDAEKIQRSPRARREREIEAFRMLTLFRDLLSAGGQSVVVYPQPIENPMGMLLHRVATEHGCRIAVPYHIRYVDRTYYSDSARECPPPKGVLQQPLQSSTLRTEVEQFLFAFRNGSAKLDRQLVSTRSTVLMEWSRVDRVKMFARRFLQVPEARRLGNLRVSLFSGWLPSLWRLIQMVRARANAGIYERDFDPFEADARFIFFPLQYTPESSINVPDPYFVDQLRAIDALRYAMPSDFVLVVKEHPAALGVRSGRFMRSVRRRPGVRVVKWNTQTRRLIETAALTVSVTGTAAFEAFLLGRPSMTLAPTFFSEAIGGSRDLTTLRNFILQSIDNELSDEVVTAGLVSIFENTAPFVSLAPETKDGKSLDSENIALLAASLRAWIDSRRVQSA